MESTAGVRFRGRGVVIEETLVIADLHLGRGASGGLQLPVGGGADILERFSSLVETASPSRIVIAGDLLHSFDTVPQTVKRTIEGLRERAGSAEIVVTRGNHDAILNRVWEGQLTEEIQIGETIVCHGHTEPENQAKRYVIGHDHPTLDIDGQRRPCALVGSTAKEDADVIMLPAFNRILRGVPVNDMGNREFQSPFLSDPGGFRPVVRDQDSRETIRFPQLGEIEAQL